MGALGVSNADLARDLRAACVAARAVVEGCLRLLDSRCFAGFLLDVVKRSGPCRLDVVLVTTDVAELIDFGVDSSGRECPLGHAVWDDVAGKMLFRQLPAGLPLLSDLVGLDERESVFLGSARVGDGLYVDHRLSAGAHDRAVKRFALPASWRPQPCRPPAGCKCQRFPDGSVEPIQLSMTAVCRLVFPGRDSKNGGSQAISRKRRPISRLFAENASQPPFWGLGGDFFRVV